MSNIGGDTNGTVKQVENISNAYDNASKSAEKLAEAQSKIENKSNIFTSNINPENLSLLLGDRLASRIKQSKIIEFKGKDKRGVVIT